MVHDRGMDRRQFLDWTLKGGLALTGTSATVRYVGSALARDHNLEEENNHTYEESILISPDEGLKLIPGEHTILTLEEFTEKTAKIKLGVVRYFEYERKNPPHNIPVILPTEAFPIISEFLSKFTGFGALRRSYHGPPHRGIDIHSLIGTPVIASHDGYILSSEYRHVAGNNIDISYGEYRVRYVHLDSRLVSAGETVTRGQIIGTLGITGSGASRVQPHLHFAVLAAGFIRNVSNPHKYWYGGPGKVTLFRPGNDDLYKAHPNRLTYPLPGRSDAPYFFGELAKFVKPTYVRPPVVSEPRTEESMQNSP